jgi:ATP synthase protein I
MDRFAKYGKRVFVSTIVTIVIFAMLSFIFPQSPFFPGFMLGTLTSLLNGWIAYVKTKQAVVNRRGGTGLFTRLLLSVFAVYLAMRFPELFGLAGVLAGLFVVLLYSVIFAYHSLR